MNDFFNTKESYNTQVLAKPGQGMSFATNEIADKFLQARKFNSGAPQHPKHAAPWYRRFDKRQKP